jgi:hypothetical protein
MQIVASEASQAKIHLITTPIMKAPKQLLSSALALIISLASASGADQLENGVPKAWLTGGLGDGKAGLSIYGLDAETVMRPNPDAPYFESTMMGGAINKWRTTPSAKNGAVIIESALGHDYGWSRGSGNAQLYINAKKQVTVTLHLRQSGVRSAAWLDGKPVELRGDENPPAEFPKPGDRPEQPMEGLTTEGLLVTAMPEKVEPPRAITLDLAPGWHSLHIKFVMQQKKGESFFFAGKFTADQNDALAAVETQTSDPTADLALHAEAAKMRPLIFVDATANLLKPGEPMRVIADMDWHFINEEPKLVNPIKPFDAILRLRIVSIDGKEIAQKEVTGTFPGKYTVEFGPAPEAGYYAIHPSLHTKDGKLILASYPDGFTVVRGNIAQRERLDKKKLWNNNYYFFPDNLDGRGHLRPGELMNWFERSGVWKNIGSLAGTSPRFDQYWEEAKRRGIVVFADTAADDLNLNEKRADGEKYIKRLAAYTPYFKCINEIDIRTGEAELKLREPKHWVERAKWEYEAVHKARPDGHYIGGSLVRPGDMGHRPRSPEALGAGAWFVECLRLGLDKYHDAWDVHAYPQNGPNFGGPFGNSRSEDEGGVHRAYEAVGRKNTLPFWYGEVGAKAAHNFTGRRGQADLTAKMIAWVNHRSDYLGIAFCIGNEYDWGRGRLWDYSMGHKPGEAAMIAAGALIDGLPYTAVDTGEKTIQAGWFGKTFMIWRSDERASDYTLKVKEAGPWVVADVVGHVSPLEAADGKLTIPISESPVYVLTKAEYENLTR